MIRGTILLKDAKKLYLKEEYIMKAKKIFTVTAVTVLLSSGPADRLRGQQP